MDLSPGDHQHLVQKAADDDTQTPFGQAYATPPAAGPRQTHGNPNTKANQRTDTYAVQISDEGSPDNSNTVTGLLAQVSVRRGENKLSLLEEKSKCSLKIFPQSGFSEKVNFAFSFSQSCFTMKHRAA